MCTEWELKTAQEYYKKCFNNLTCAQKTFQLCQFVFVDSLSEQIKLATFPGSYLLSKHLSKTIEPQEIVSAARIL